MDGQQVNLFDHPDKLCRTRWRTDRPGGAAFVGFLAVGELGDGRWYVDVVDVPGRGNRHAHAYPDERTARAAVEQLQAGSPAPWKRVPCYPSPEDSRYDGDTLT